MIRWNYYSAFLLHVCTFQLIITLESIEMSCICWMRPPCGEYNDTRDFIKTGGHTRVHRCYSNGTGNTRYKDWVPRNISNETNMSIIKVLMGMATQPVLADTYPENIEPCDGSVPCPQ